MYSENDESEYYVYLNDLPQGIGRNSNRPYLHVRVYFPAMVNMDANVRLLVGMLLLAATSANPIRTPWTSVLFRRQAPPLICTSYSELQLVLDDKFNRVASGAARDLFEHDTHVTHDEMSSLAEGMCSDLASITDQFLDELTSCPNEDEVKSNMNIFSGLCWANGTMTSLLQELLTGFKSVNFGWDTECGELVRPILGICGGDPIHQSKDMTAGPKVYKRIMTKQESCISSHFDTVDGVAGACGDIESLKILAHILNLLFKLGPGVIFQLSDFGLD
ncbi:uncharacterized protein [Argopecten irradians]|uniref:uncharacterized protein n=1 Tax=Argopecten irradians TaxID=31199 RepID=UPI003715A339